MNLYCVSVKKNEQSSYFLSEDFITCIDEIRAVFGDRIARELGLLWIQSDTEATLYSVEVEETDPTDRAHVGAFVELRLLDEGQWFGAVEDDVEED